MVLAVALAAGCGGVPDDTGADRSRGQSSRAGEAWFRSVERSIGLEFTHRNGMAGRLDMVEMMGSGAALFDCDRDGDLDAYLPQGRPLGPGAEAPESPGGRLFRNRLEDGALGFEDATEASGLEALEYGLGVAVGDLDGDGDLDLYLSNFGPNELWRNLGACTFEPVPEAGGAQDGRWNASATFFDGDGDGDLDLFVAGYVDYGPENRRRCTSPSGRPDYCSPASYRSEPDRFFRNRGDGTFEDATASSGIAAAFHDGLGVVAVDFDGEHGLDLYVANDLSENLLWLNRGDGTFRNGARLAGVAVNEAGRAEAGMGVVAADFDEDGDVDLFLTHLVGETNTLYVNQGGGMFLDQTRRFGLAMPSVARTGFGAAAVDGDNDGWLDLVVVNGAVTVIEELALAGDPFPLEMADQLFVRGAGDVFEERPGGLDPSLPDEVGRGLAVGDVDNDGDTDLLIANNHGPARLLRNEVGQRAHWIGFEVLAQREPPLEALGARVVVETRAGVRRHRRVAIDGSYLSSSDPRVLVGLGAEDEVARVRVEWLQGGAEEWVGLAADRYHRLVRGEGRTVRGRAAP